MSAALSIGTAGEAPASAARPAAISITPTLTRPATSSPRLGRSRQALTETRWSPLPEKPNRESSHDRIVSLRQRAEQAEQRADSLERERDEEEVGSSAGVGDSARTPDSLPRSLASDLEGNQRTPSAASSTICVHGFPGVGGDWVSFDEAKGAYQALEKRLGEARRALEIALWGLRDPQSSDMRTKARWSVEKVLDSEDSPSYFVGAQPPAGHSPSPSQDPETREECPECGKQGCPWHMPDIDALERAAEDIDHLEDAGVREWSELMLRLEDEGWRLRRLAPPHGPIAQQEDVADQPSERHK